MCGGRTCHQQPGRCAHGQFCLIIFNFSFNSCFNSFFRALPQRPPQGRARTPPAGCPGRACPSSARPPDLSAPAARRRHRHLLGQPARGGPCGGERGRGGPRVMWAGPAQRDGRGSARRRRRAARRPSLLRHPPPRPSQGRWVAALSGSAERPSPSRGPFRWARPCS